MRSVVLRKRLNNLMVAVSVGALSIAISACSSGFQRFDSSFYEDALPQQTASAANPYPDNVDPITTASTGSRLSPIADVGLKPDPIGVYHDPEPTYAAPGVNGAPVQTAQPAAQQFQNYAPAQVAQHSRAAPWSDAGRITSSELGKVTSSSSVQRKPLYDELESAVNAPSVAPLDARAPVTTYTPPAPEPQIAKTTDGTVYIPPAQSTDSIHTASVRPSASAPAAPVREAGWTGIGGTSIAVRPGETLYNLSKRYGVPASEIRRVNNLSAGAQLQAGQRIVIPSYVYGPGAAVSAPDNNPETRASKAGVGYLGEADINSVAVPTQKPFYQAAVSPSGTTSDQQQRRYQPKTHSAPPEQESTPDYGVVTGSLDHKNTYVVQPGDTLSGIADKTGSTISTLQQINGISGSEIRAGQSLRLPGPGGIGEQAEGFAGNTGHTTAIHGVDPIVTGGVPQSVNKTQTTIPQARETVQKSASEIAKQSTGVTAPAATGIENFRWPVSGRVIEKFGAATAGGSNDGIDISVPQGTAVRAAENGVVIYAGDEISEYGNLILIRHSDDWVSAYAHNRDFEIKKGDRVARGQIIARSGATGDAQLPKLHFELRKHSRPVDPVKYLTGA